MATSPDAPRNMSTSWLGRGRGNGNPRGRGNNVRGRGRGRGGHATNGGDRSHQPRTAGRGRPHLVTLSEYSRASVIPVERRQRVYLSGDRPQDTNNNTTPSEASPGDKDQGESDSNSPVTAGEDGGTASPPGNVAGAESSQSSGIMEDAGDDVWPRPTYIERFKRPPGNMTPEPAEAPPVEGASNPPAPERRPQDPDDLLIFDDDLKPVAVKQDDSNDTGQ